MSKLLLVLCLVLALGSCTTWPHPTPPHTAQAPRAARHYYHHRQRVNHRARARRHPRPLFSWKKR